MAIVQILIIIAVIVAVLTGVYKLLPFRHVGKLRPRFALMPKYKASLDRGIAAGLTAKDIERVLSGLGFNKVNEAAEQQTYVRGSLMGDLSIDLMKVALFVSINPNQETQVFLQASWMVAFDNGDHWQLLKEVCDKFNAIEPV